MSPEPANLLSAQALEQAEELAARRDFDRARRVLLAAAEDLQNQQESKAAARLLQRALQFPGDTSGVWLALGGLSAVCGADEQAMQELKTGVWLAMKMGLVERVREGLERIDLLDAQPEAAWREKTETWLADRDAQATGSAVEGQIPRICDFCGRDDFVAGELFEGVRASICPGCVHQLHMKIECVSGQAESDAE